MSFHRQLLAALVATLSACGGGGSNAGGGNPPPPPPPPTNTAPTVDAGPDQTVAELSVVQLSGVANDINNDPLTYSWAQTAGTAVNLNNAASENADFTAPDVPPSTSEDLTFRLTVSDGAGGSTTDDVIVSVQEPGTIMNLSGTLEYEFPPPNNNCNGLNFNNVIQRPIREATVQIIDSGNNALIMQTSTDPNGFYTVTLDANINVFVRVISELKRSGNPSWDVDVRNNVVDPLDPAPPLLNARPKYFLDSSPFNTGGINLTRDLLAGTGNGGSGPRAAAPFSVLDTIYEMMQLVLSADPTANLPPLDAFWSPDNIASPGTGNFFDDIDSGEISTSFYSGGFLSSLFLLGAENNDTEEFDDHVIAHEWGHYFEDKFSRSDSIGGAHSIGNRLDMRVAFGEGFATALSGMGLNDPLYCDSFGSSTGFSIDIESENGGLAGWFNESSVMKIAFDLWDSNDEGGDPGSIGFSPIFSVMTGAQQTTPAYTSIFSFAAALKALPGADTAFINSQLARENIAGLGITAFAAGESNSGGAASDVLPVYTDIMIGNTLQICSNSQFDNGREGNKLSEVRFLRLNLSSSQTVTITVDTVNPATTPTPGFDCVAAINAGEPLDPEINTHSDPDIEVWRNGQSVITGFSCQPNQEITAQTFLTSGTYAIDVTEFRYADEDTNTPGGFPERTCFDVTIN